MGSSGKNKNQWFVYILHCSDGSLYTGITTDTERRVKEHNGPKKGAKYTRCRQPVDLIFKEEALNRSIATKREIQIKKLTHSAKLHLIKGA